jgi:hypothetical protein
MLKVSSSQLIIRKGGMEEKGGIEIFQSLVVPTTMVNFSRTPLLFDV